MITKNTPRIVKKNIEFKSYIMALYKLSNVIMEKLLEKNNKTAIIVPLRGGYPIYLALLKILSEEIENKKINKNLLGNLEIYLLPASASKKEVHKYFLNKMENILSKERYNRIILMDEARSGGSVTHTVRLVRKVFNKKLLVYLLAETQSGKTDERQKIHFRELRKLTNFFLPIYCLRVVTMDNKRKLGVYYVKENNDYKIVTFFMSPEEFDEKWFKKFFYSLKIVYYNNLLT